MPLAILVVLTIVGVSYTRIIQVIVLTGVLSLGVWAGVAGRRAGLSAWALVFSIVYGLFLGASSWCFRRCSSPGISLSVHDRRGFGASGKGVSGNGLRGGVQRRRRAALPRRVDDRHGGRVARGWF